jgi:hypothetical protein
MAGDYAPFVMAADPHVRDQELGFPSAIGNTRFPLELAAQDRGGIEDLRRAIAEGTRNQLDAIEVGNVIGLGELLPTRSPGDQRELVVEDVIERQSGALLDGAHPLAFAGKDFLVVHEGLEGTSVANPAASVSGEMNRVEKMRNSRL